MDSTEKKKLNQSSVSIYAANMSYHCEVKKLSWIT